MKLQDRLSDVLNYTGLNRSALAQKIGVKAYKLQDISRGQTVRMPSDVLDGLSREFPNLNPTWLLTGEGEMLLPDEEDKYRKKPDITAIEPPEGMELTPENSVTYHPDLLVTGGDVENVSGDELSTAQLYIPGYEGCHAIQAVGHSMYPTIASGDIVICKRYTDRFVVNGDIYVVNTHDQALVKRVIAHNAPGPEDSYFELRSDNPKTDLYVPMRVRGEDVTSLYKVLAIIRRL